MDQELSYPTKQKKKTVRLVNPLNQEEWFCEDYNNITEVDGVVFVRVYKPSNPDRKFLMKRDALRKATPF